VTPSFDNGRVPQEENQSPRVSTTAESLRRRISHPEFRKRPSPSGGEDRFRPCPTSTLLTPPLGHRRLWLRRAGKPPRRCGEQLGLLGKCVAPLGIEIPKRNISHPRNIDFDHVPLLPLSLPHSAADTCSYVELEDQSRRCGEQLGLLGECMAALGIEISKRKISNFHLFPTFLTPPLGRRHL
jgi:hypothetical protein